MADSLRAMSVGLLAFIGSFLLFGLGTAAALTRPYWHKSETGSDVNSSRMANSDGGNR
jgi:hypothetical protein